MNRYQYKGNIKKGRCSQAAKQAQYDMLTDDCTKILDYYDVGGHPHYRRTILNEDKIGIEI